MENPIVPIVPLNVEGGFQYVRVSTYRTTKNIMTLSLRKMTQIELIAAVADLLQPPLFRTLLLRYQSWVEMLYDV